MDGVSLVLQCGSMNNAYLSVKDAFCCDTMTAVFYLTVPWLLLGLVGCCCGCCCAGFGRTLWHLPKEGEEKPFSLSVQPVAGEDPPLLMVRLPPPPYPTGPCALRATTPPYPLPRCTGRCEREHGPGRQDRAGRRGGQRAEPRHGGHRPHPRGQGTPPVPRPRMGPPHHDSLSLPPLRQRGHYKVAERLVKKHSADPNVFNNDGAGALLCAIVAVRCRGWNSCRDNSR